MKIKISNARLKEGTTSYTLEEERQLKNDIIADLKKSGHAFYAKRLAAYDFQIVPLDTKDKRFGESFTAAISYVDGKIFLSEGFLGEPDAMKQLNLLMRHELAHNLLTHDIRILSEFKRKGILNTERQLGSYTLHRLINIIADDEISNRIYDEYDKDTVRNMRRSGEVIGGLVTEDHRTDWQKLTLEQLFEELENTIKDIHKDIRYYIKHDSLAQNIDALGNETVWNSRLKTHIPDMINNEYLRGILGTYADYSGNSSINVPLVQYFKSSKFAELPEVYKNIQLTTYNAYKEAETGNVAKIAQVERLLKNIAQTDIFTEFKNSKLSLATAEEKFAACDILKALLGRFDDSEDLDLPQEYVDAWNTVMDICDNEDLTVTELQKILADLDINMSK